MSKRANGKRLSTKSASRWSEALIALTGSATLPMVTVLLLLQERLWIPLAAQQESGGSANWAVQQKDRPKAVSLQR
jgi:hypothetical protein